MVTPSPQKELIPLPAPVAPKIDTPIQSAPRSLPVPAPAPSAAPGPAAPVARSRPEPAQATDKTVAPLPAVSPRETANAVSGALNPPSVQRGPVRIPAESAPGGKYAPKDASEVQPVIGPSFEAAYLSNPGPKYPAAARRLKLQGTATVRVLVSPEGGPRSVTLSKTSGTRILDQAALEAVQQWSFVPARRGGKPVAAEVDVPVRFRLN